jgi:hypothetical protein
LRISGIAPIRIEQHQHAQPSLFHVLQMLAGAGGKVDVLAQQQGVGFGSAFGRKVGEIQSLAQAEQLGGQLLLAVQARGAVGQTRMGGGVGAELVDGLEGRIATHDQRPDVAGILGDQSEVFQRIIGRPEYVRPHRDHAGGHHAQGVAIGFCAGHQGGGHAGGRAGFVFREDGDAQQLLQALAQGARAQVGGRAGAVAHVQADRLDGECLALREQGQAGQCCEQH